MTAKACVAQTGHMTLQEAIALISEFIRDRDVVDRQHFKAAQKVLEAAQSHHRATAHEEGDPS